MANDPIDNLTNPASDMFGSFLQPVKSPEEFNMIEDAQKRFDSGTARVPATEIPMRPGGTESGAKGEAPEDEGDLTAKDLFHFATTVLAPKQAQPARPGSFGHKLSQAVQGAEAGIGDAAAGIQTPGGPLAAVAGTLAAGRQRKQGEKKEAFEMAEKKRMDDINYAHAQIQTLTAQQTLRHAAAEDRNAALQYDQAIASDLDEVGTPVLQRNMDSDQLQKWMQDANNKDKVNNVTAVIDHYLPPDKNGYARPVYTLYDQIPEEVHLSKDSAAFLSKFSLDGKSYDAGTEIPGSTYIRMMKRATSNQGAVAARDKLISEAYKDNAEGRKNAEEAVSKLESRQALDRIANTMNQPGIRWDPTKALSLASKLKATARTPEERQKADQFARDVEVGFGADLLEKERARTADEQLRLLEMANRRQENKDDKDRTAGLASLTKDSETFSKTAKSMATTLADINRAQDGDQLASSMAKLLVALGVTTSEDVRRINENEINAAGPQVGSLIRKTQALFKGYTSGTLPADTLREMRDMARSIQDIAYKQYVGVQMQTQRNRNLDGDATFVLSSDGLSQVSLNDARQQAEYDTRRFYASQGQVPPGSLGIKNAQGEVVAYTPDKGKTKFDIRTGQPWKPPILPPGTVAGAQQMMK